jgi:DNA-binding MarR family transcriptional regulator
MPSASFILDKDEVNESLFMHDIARLFKKDFDRRVRKLNLTRAQWMALSVLRRFPGINQVELADKLEVEPMTIARLVDRMEEAKWVERRADGADRRVKRLYLTPRAQNIITKLRAIALETRQDALSGITEKEHQALIRILPKIKKNLCTKSGVLCVGK